MATEIELVNVALVALGQTELLTSLDDQTKHARVMKAVLRVARRAVLACRPWSFARRRIKLNASNVAPLFGPGTAYPLPDDFVRFLIDKDNPDQDFRVEAGMIVSDDGAPLEILYIYDETNIERWSAVATELLAAALAAYAAYAITGDKGVRDDMEAIYSKRLSHAGAVDLFNEEPDTLDADVWIRAHQRGW